jgi:hypothetical protein
MNTLNTLKKLLITTTGGFLVALGIVSTAQASQLIYGESNPLGDGMVRSWVKLDDNKNPLDIGLSFSQEALDNLPLEGESEYELSLPQEASATAFTHIGLNWQSHGHPGGVYALPHFDFHFYTISPEERQGITATSEDLPKINKLPSAEFMPADYKPAYGTAAPGMGLHWIDSNSDEFNGETFAKTFIYGSYNENVTFWEPMITKAYFETNPNFTEALKLPDAYAESGYYPTEYSIKYDPDSKEYMVSLNNLTYRRAVPEASLTLGLLAFGTLSAGLQLLRKKASVS